MLNSPHIHSGSSTNRIMIDVMIALIPAFAAAVVFFGLMALILTVVVITAAIAFDWGVRLIIKKDATKIIDPAVVLTALIMALGIPAHTPIWLAVLATGVAIIAVKHIAKRIFKGIFRSTLNPALIGHMAVTAFGAYVVYYPVAMAWMGGVDVTVAATPLRAMIEGCHTLPTTGELFLGLHGGTIGETSVLALLIGGGYLVWRRVISLAIPLTFIGTTILILAIAGQDPVFHLFTGALVFVAIFMATDYVTSPTTLKGKIIFGIGCGLITALMRLYGWSTEGVSIALIAMNFATPLIERFTLPRPFGGKV